jgi:hypothetical protein
MNNPHTRAIRFLAGFALGVACALAPNLFPNVSSFGGYRTDGYEVAGFPFTFWQIGGLSFTREFNVPLLAADVGLALWFAVIVGGLCMERFGRIDF